jgi:hypothetical protein
MHWMCSTNALTRCAVAFFHRSTAGASALCPGRNVAASESPSAVTIVTSCAGARADSTVECTERTSTEPITQLMKSSAAISNGSLNKTLVRRPLDFTVRPTRSR